MKRLAMLTVLLIFFLAGCGVSEAENKTEEASELNTQASTHYSNGNLASALEVYQRSLAIKEDVSVREKLTNIKEELAAVEKVDAIWDDLKKYPLDLQHNAEISQAIDTTNNIDQKINELSNIKAPSDSEIARYIEEISKKADYFSLQTQLTMFNLQLKGAVPFDNESLSKLNQTIETLIKDNPLPEFYK